MAEPIKSIPEDKLKKLIRFRFSVIQANPIRTWEIDGKEYSFSRGSNMPKGLHMSNLGAMVRHIFYDKKTQVIYSLDGALSRKHALIDDPDFWEVLRFEWGNDIWYSPFMPHSLEYIAKTYKYLIQNVIEPDMDIDSLKEFIRNMILSSFGKLTIIHSDTPVHSMQEKKEMDEKRNKEFRGFGNALFEVAEELRGYRPHRAQIRQDHSNYSMEAEYEDSDKRYNAIRKILEE